MAVAAARLVRTLSRAAGRHGSSLPGLVAERIDPRILEELRASVGPITVVLGTNGKTTTTRLLASILERSNGTPPVTNRSGANLRQGIVTALLARRDIVSGRLGQPAGVFEVDELAFSNLAGVLRPAVIVVMNLLRDQLDRYGEIDAVQARWTGDFARLPDDAILVACADDPRVETAIAPGRRRVLRFGLVKPARDGVATAPDPASPIDAARCPECGSTVRFASAWIHGLGDWRCPTCGRRRSRCDLAARMTGTNDGAWLGLEFREASVADAAEPAGSFSGSRAAARIRLTGVAAAYDAAAAVLAARGLGIDLHLAASGIDGATPAFGRLEELALGAKRVILTLAKNPVSMAQVVESVVVRHPDGLLIGLGDRPADGRDPSWIWDSALDGLAGIAPITLTGSRADDLALRFKYSRVEASPTPLPPRVDGKLATALDSALEPIRPGGTLMIVATYTTLLGIRQLLERRGAQPATAA